MTQHGATLQAVVKAIHGRRNGGNTTSAGLYSVS